MTTSSLGLGLKALAATLVAVGLLCVLLGYLGVRRNDDIVLQLPYLASGGVGGLALIALGAVVLIVSDARAEPGGFAAVSESLRSEGIGHGERGPSWTSATLELEVPAGNPPFRDRRGRARH